MSANSRQRKIWTWQRMPTKDDQKQIVEHRLPGRVPLIITRVLRRSINSCTLRDVRKSMWSTELYTHQRLSTRGSFWLLHPICLLYHYERICCWRSRIQSRHQCHHGLALGCRFWNWVTRSLQFIVTRSTTVYLINCPGHIANSFPYSRSIALPKDDVYSQGSVVALALIFLEACIIGTWA